MREKLEGKENTFVLARGKVVSGGEHLSISGEENLRQPEIMAPYGLYFRPPEGTAVLCAGGKVLGVPMEVLSGLEDGEILIKNAFGAELKLCSDGAVEINGRRFERSDG